MDTTMPDRFETARCRRRTRSRRFVTCVTTMVGLTLGASRARADDPWLVALEGGGSKVHDDLRTAVGALRVSHDLGASPFRIQLGAAASSYGTLDLGLEWRARQRARVSPFLGIGGGLMSEEDYIGPFWRATGGLEARLSERAVLRLTLQGGIHDGQAGPHQATIGFGWRF